MTVVALASGITYWLTVREFKQLVFNQSQDRFVAEAALYYQVNGTWDGVLDYFNLRNSFPQPGGPDLQPDQQPFGPAVRSTPISFYSTSFWRMPMGRFSSRPGNTRLVTIVPHAKLSQGTAD